MPAENIAELEVLLAKLAASKGANLDSASLDQSPEALLHSVAIFGDLARASGQLQSQAVASAQAAGLSWAKIGNALGVSRQAAQQRFDSRRFEPATASPTTRILGPVSRSDEIEQLMAAGQQGWKLIRSLHGEHVLEHSDCAWEVMRVSVFSPRAMPSAAQGWHAASTRFPDCFYLRRQGS